MGDGVTYEFKELFDRFEKALSDGFNRLDHRLDELNRRLDNKADNTRVAALEQKVAEHEIAVDGRFKPLEIAVAGTAAVSRFQRWALGTVGVGVLGAIATLVWLASGGH